LTRTPSVLMLVFALAWTTSSLLGAPAAPTVQIKAKEFRFDPKEVTIKPGEVIFAVKNEGEIEHNFVIEDAAGKKLAEIATILPDKSEQVRVTLKAAKYSILCSLPGHKDAGMHATLTVQE